MKNIMKFLNNLTIKKQLLIYAFLFIFSLFSVGARSIYDEIKSLEHDQLIHLAVTVPLADIALAMDAIHSVRYDITEILNHPSQRQTELQDLKQSLEAFEKHWQHYYKSLDVMAGEAERVQANKIQSELNTFKQQITQFQQQAAQQNEESSETFQAETAKTLQAVTVLIHETRQLSTLLLDLSEEIFEESSTASNQTILLNIGLLIISIVVSLIFTFALVFFIRRNLDRAVLAAQSIAAKKLDYPIPERSPNTELGQLFLSFKEMQNNLRSVIGNMRESGNKLVNSATQLADSTEQILRSSSQQSKSASSAAAAVEELTASINHVNTQASNTHSTAERSRQDSLHSSEIIRQAAEQVQAIANSIRESVLFAEDLSSRSREIDQIVNTIHEIADQTNLLALNAAIEAARAGEAGRGFAVVADAVRDLAVRTTNSTAEVGKVIDTIRSGIQHMADDMRNSEAQVADGVARANEAKDAIDNITNSAQHVLELIAGIATALQQQNTSSQLVAKSVEHIAHMAETNNHAVEKVSDASKELDALAHDLNQEVSTFKF